MKKTITLAIILIATFALPIFAVKEKREKLDIVSELMNKGYSEKNAQMIEITNYIKAVDYSQKKKLSKRVVKSIKATGLSKLQILANQNDGHAQYLLGLSYESGLLSKKNLTLSIDYYQKAIQNKIQDATVALERALHAKQIDDVRRANNRAMWGTVIGTAVVTAAIISNNSTNGASSNSNVRTNSSSSSLEKTKPCSMCDGTGFVHDNNITNYSGESEKWCEGCKKWVSPSHNHRGKICPSCKGEGKK